MFFGGGSGGGATRPFPKDGGIEELHGDATVGRFICSSSWFEILKYVYFLTN